MLMPRSEGRSCLKTDTQTGLKGSYQPIEIDMRHAENLVFVFDNQLS
jgi:hypothetical protein